MIQSQTAPSVATSQRHRGGRRALRRAVLAALAASLVTSTLAVAPVAAASPGGGLVQESVIVSDDAAVDLSVEIASTTLLGTDVPVALTAWNSTPSNVFNLSMSVVLPPAVSYVAGSSRVGETPLAEPVVTTSESATVLVWSNVSDLLAGTASTVRFAVRAGDELSVGDRIEMSGFAAVSADPRMVPDFDSVSGAPVDDSMSEDTAAAATVLTAFDVTLHEPSAERELLRGVHDHRSVMTVSVENNAVAATDDVALTVYLPAGLEFLGCGDEDNSAAGVTEYVGAQRLDAQPAPVMEHPCVTPSAAATEQVDPDADGPLLAGVYTRVEWSAAALSAAWGSSTLAPGASSSLDFVVGIPMRSNELAAGNPIANLDNNTGALTADEQVVTSAATGSGRFGGVLPATDGDTEIIVAEDVSVHTAASSVVLAQGASTTWTLLIETSEYAVSTGAVEIVETVPDGLDVVRVEPQALAGSPTVNPNGTTTVRWQLPAFTEPSATANVLYETVTRTSYRSSGSSVVSRDAWTSATSLVTDGSVMVSDDGGTSLRPTPDASAAGQVAGGPVISKSVAAPVASGGVCGDGAGLSFDPDLSGPFGPGDRVCWKLSVVFPTALDTAAVVVQDFLPAGFRYEQHSATPASTVSSGFIDVSPLLQWDLGTVDAGGQRFEVVVQTIVDDPNAGRPHDVKANLMKLRFENSAGLAAQLRDHADVSWAEPVLDVAVAVAAINGESSAVGPAERVAVEAGDRVTLDVTVRNTGNAAATAIGLMAELPGSLSCGHVAAISGSGACDGSPGLIVWADVDVAAGATAQRRFDVDIPIGVAAGVELRVDAAVTQFSGLTNTGAPFHFVPGSNTSDSAGTIALETPSPRVNVTRETAISEGGNAEAAEATIGEAVTVRTEVVLPAGTTLYGGSQLLFPLDARITVEPGSIVARLDGAELPAGWQLELSDAALSVRLPGTYAIPAGLDQQLTVELSAVISDVAGNTRGEVVTTRSTFSWADADGAGKAAAGQARTTIVEPALLVRRDVDAATVAAGGVVAPGSTASYIVEVGNDLDAATAHDIDVVDTLPPELTVLNLAGAPANDGDVVAAGGATYDAETHTVTWSLASLAPGAAEITAYDV